MFEKYIKSLNPYNELRLYNIVAAGINLSQGLIILYTAQAYRLPVLIAYLKIDGTKATHIARQLFTIDMHLIIAACLIIAGLVHIYAVTLGIKRYFGDIEHGINSMRWYEYAVTSSLMILSVALLLGIYDIRVLLQIFTLNAAMVLFGLMMESRNQHYPIIRWRPFVLGALVGAVPWAIMLVHLYLVYGALASIPRPLLMLLITVFGMFILFPVNMYLHYRQVGFWKNYLFTESVYITLSLSAKSALAWQIYRVFLRG